jgi:hypothetical protein
MDLTSGAELATPVRWNGKKGSRASTKLLKMEIGEHPHYLGSIGATFGDATWPRPIMTCQCFRILVVNNFLAVSLLSTSPLWVIGQSRNEFPKVICLEDRFVYEAVEVPRSGVRPIPEMHESAMQVHGWGGVLEQWSKFCIAVIGLNTHRAWIHDYFSFCVSQSTSHCTLSSDEYLKFRHALLHTPALHNGEGIWMTPVDSSRGSWWPHLPQLFNPRWWFSPLTNFCWQFKSIEWVVLEGEMHINHHAVWSLYPVQRQIRTTDALPVAVAVHGLEVENQQAHNGILPTLKFLGSASH